MNKLQKVLINTSLLALTSYSSFALAQAPKLPVDCPGYKLPKTKLFSQSVGKKLQSAYDVYLNEEMDEKIRTEQTITMLKEVETDAPFDRSSVDYLLGRIIVQQEGMADEALVLLKKTAESGQLNDKDQASLLELVGNLAIQQEEYETSISFYNKWMDFTCKENADIYVRMAKAYLEMKNYQQVIASADKAIATYEEPNKNPYVLKISALHELKQYPELVKVGEILVETFPEEKVWWPQLGFFYMMVEDFDKALSTMALAYKKGLLTKKSQLNALVQLYSSSGVPDKSAELQLKYMEAGILDTEADNYASLANTYQLAREYSDAAKFYGKAASMSNNPEHYRKQGVLLLTAEDYKGAVTALTKAIENDVKAPGKVHFSLMEAHFYLGDFRAANVHAKEARKEPSLRRNANAWMPYIKQKADNRGIKI